MVMGPVGEMPCGLQSRPGRLEEPGPAWPGGAGCTCTPCSPPCLGPDQPPRRARRRACGRACQTRRPSGGSAGGCQSRTTRSRRAGAGPGAGAAPAGAPGAGRRRGPCAAPRTGSGRRRRGRWPGTGAAGRGRPWRGRAARWAAAPPPGPAPPPAPAWGFRTAGEGGRWRCVRCRRGRRLTRQAGGCARRTAGRRPASQPASQAQAMPLARHRPQTHPPAPTRPRLDPRAPLKERGAVGPLAHALQRVHQVGVGFWEVGAQAQRGAVAAQRLVVPAAVLEGGPQVGVGLGGLGLQGVAGAVGWGGVGWGGQGTAAPALAAPRLPASSQPARLPASQPKCRAGMQGWRPAHALQHARSSHPPAGRPRARSTGCTRPGAPSA